VLDFIGQQHRRFRFDLRYRALLGGSRRQLETQLQQGFPFLPAGCRLVLDRVASDRVLTNLRQSLPSRCPQLLEELRARGIDIDLGGVFGGNQGVIVAPGPNAGGGMRFIVPPSGGFAMPGGGPDFAEFEERMRRMQEELERAMQRLDRMRPVAPAPPAPAPAPPPSGREA
jgi:hypothetical protein